MDSVAAADALLAPPAPQKQIHYLLHQQMHCWHHLHAEADPLRYQQMHCWRHQHRPNLLLKNRYASCRSTSSATPVGEEFVAAGAKIRISSEVDDVPGDKLEELYMRLKVNSQC